MEEHKDKDALSMQKDPSKPSEIPVSQTTELSKAKEKRSGKRKNKSLKKRNKEEKSQSQESLPKLKRKSKIVTEGNIPNSKVVTKSKVEKLFEDAGSAQMEVSKNIQSSVVAVNPPKEGQSQEVQSPEEKGQDAKRKTLKKKKKKETQEGQGSPQEKKQEEKQQPSKKSNKKKQQSLGEKKLYGEAHPEEEKEKKEEMDYPPQDLDSDEEVLQVQERIVGDSGKSLKRPTLKKIRKNKEETKKKKKVEEPEEIKQFEKRENVEDDNLKPMKFPNKGKSGGLNFAKDKISFGKRNLEWNWPTGWFKRETENYFYIKRNGETWRIPIGFMEDGPYRCIYELWALGYRLSNRRIPKFEKLVGDKEQKNSFYVGEILASTLGIPPTYLVRPFAKDLADCVWVEEGSLDCPYLLKMFKKTAEQHSGWLLKRFLPVKDLDIQYEKPAAYRSTALSNTSCKNPARIRSYKRKIWSQEKVCVADALRYITGKKITSRQARDLRRDSEEVNTFCQRVHSLYGLSIRFMFNCSVTIKETVTNFLANPPLLPVLVLTKGYLPHCFVAFKDFLGEGAALVGPFINDESLDQIELDVMAFEVPLAEPKLEGEKIPITAFFTQ